MKKKILFKLTGSIACYKACQAISGLVQRGYDVQTVASFSALKFVGEATLEGLTGKSVLKDLWASGTAMDHIHLVRDADLIVVAPATANFINSIANGLGGDLLSTMSLAHDFKKPYLIAPAMNATMLAHPATQASLKKLKIMGYDVLQTEAGSLACGEKGEGRLIEPEALIAEIENQLGVKPAPKAENALKILVTAGGTQVPIDSVRAITNSSTGRTGSRLARHLELSGHQVTLLISEGGRREDFLGRTLTYSTVPDLEHALKAELSTNHYDIVIHAAAISDFSIKDLKAGVSHGDLSQLGKIQSDSDVTITLTPGPKLIQHIQGWSLNQDISLVAFKLTAGANAHQAQEAVGKVFYNPGVIAVIHNDQKEIREGQHKFNLWLDPDAVRAQFARIEDVVDEILKNSLPHKTGGLHDSHP